MMIIDPKRLMELAYDKAPANENETELVALATIIDPAVWRIKHRWRRVDTLKSAVRLIESGRLRPIFNFTVELRPARKSFLSRFRRAA